MHWTISYRTVVIIIRLEFLNRYNTFENHLDTDYLRSTHDNC